ncbi:MAG: hypothetical protein H0X37_05110 [Herpetosiphonaceae bacterium]|nr:hypothetical protein [Herpetosiphonaceae bacterium]
MDEPSYHSFLLRLWREPQLAGNGWHGEIESIQTGSIIAVSSLKDAFRVIQQTVDANEEQQDGEIPEPHLTS